MNVSMAKPYETAIILFAEDCDEDLFLCERALKQAGIHAHAYFVRDGVEAKQWLEGEGIYADRQKFPLPHLLVTDLNMPRMDGFELIRWVRCQPHLIKLPIVVLSSSNAAPDLRHAMDLGASTYIVKSPHLEKLVTYLLPVIPIVAAECMTDGGQAMAERR
jgi:CheY-like chemotaxis protein